MVAHESHKLACGSSILPAATNMGLQWFRHNVNQRTERYGRGFDSLRLHQYKQLKEKSMETKKELDLLDENGTGFNVTFYDTEEVEITYFQNFHCVDYVFVSMGTWETYFKNLK